MKIAGRLELEQLYSQWSYAKLLKIWKKSIHFYWNLYESFAYVRWQERRTFYGKLFIRGKSVQCFNWIRTAACKQIYKAETSIDIIHTHTNCPLTKCEKEKNGKAENCIEYIK